MLSRRDVDEILTLSCKIIKKLLFSFFYDQKIKNYKNDLLFDMIKVREFLRLSFLCFKHFERAKMMLCHWLFYFLFSFKSITLSVLDDKEIIYILRLTRGREI